MASRRPCNLAPLHVLGSRLAVEQSGAEWVQPVLGAWTPRTLLPGRQVSRGFPGSPACALCQGGRIPSCSLPLFSTSRALCWLPAWPRVRGRGLRFSWPWCGERHVGGFSMALLKILLFWFVFKRESECESMYVCVCVSCLHPRKVPARDSKVPGFILGPASVQCGWPSGRPQVRLPAPGLRVWVARTPTGRRTAHTQQ